MLAKVAVSCVLNDLAKATCHTFNVSRAKIMIRILLPSLLHDHLQLLLRTRCACFITMVIVKIQGESSSNTKNVLLATGKRDICKTIERGLDKIQIFYVKGCTRNLKCSLVSHHTFIHVL